jgi:hypothetical protein
MEVVVVAAAPCRQSTWEVAVAALLAWEVEEAVALLALEVEEASASTSCKAAVAASTR